MSEFVCKICGKKSKSLCGIYRHARISHKYSTKEYFDEFIEPFEHICPYCKRNELHWWKYYYGKSCDDEACKRKAASAGFSTVDQLSKVNKMRSTKLSKYGNANYNNPIQNKKTLVNRYGTDCSFKIAKVKEKVNETWYERYGGHPMKSDIVKKKLEQVMLSRYGYRNSSQVPSICSRKSKYKYCSGGYEFDSVAELKVFEYCIENKLQVKYEPKSIEYTDELGNQHFYIPDFEIEGKLYEVKGDYLLNENDEIIFPYRNTLTEEELVKLDARDRAKTVCMKENGVTIIRSSQIYKLQNLIK